MARRALCWLNRAVELYRLKHDPRTPRGLNQTVQLFGLNNSRFGSKAMILAQTPLFWVSLTPAVRQTWPTEARVAKMGRLVA